MNSFERVRAALAGGEVDRPPFGFWTHLPETDLDPDALARDSAAFARRFGMDFLKSMPNGFYCVEDWGVTVDYSEVAKGGVAKPTSLPVRSPEDWRRLKRLDVRQGAYGRELRHLTLLVGQLRDMPVLATVFSPLTIASKMMKGRLAEHARMAPEALRAGLALIAEVTDAFAAAALDAGCAGIFLATQMATTDALTEAEYAELGVTYDRKLLEGAGRRGWFNALHLHGERVMFDLVKDYPVHALNWHIWETEPTIGAYRVAGGRKPVLGGLQRMNITRSDLPAIEQDLARTLDQNGTRGLLVAPACVIRHPVDEATLDAIAARVRGLSAALPLLAGEGPSSA